MTNSFDFPPPSLKTGFEIDKRIEQFTQISKEGRWHEYSLKPAVIVVPDKGKPFMSLLRDIVATSSVVSEKIVDVCSDAKIFLELDFRGA